MNTVYIYRVPPYIYIEFAYLLLPYVSWVLPDLNYTPGRASDPHMFTGGSSTGCQELGVQSYACIWTMRERLPSHLRGRDTR